MKIKRDSRGAADIVHNQRENRSRVARMTALGCKSSTRDVAMKDDAQRTSLVSIRV